MDISPFSRMVDVEAAYRANGFALRTNRKGGFVAVPVTVHQDAAIAQHNARVDAIAQRLKRQPVSALLAINLSNPEDAAALARLTWHLERIVEDIADILAPDGAGL